MFRKLLFVCVISVFTLSNFVLADSQGNSNGKPFTEIWDEINNHEERILDLENKLSVVEDNPAIYTVDFQKCLSSENSEATIPYSNGANSSQTLIWNCADYRDESTWGSPYGDQHIELFFTSDDGQCFKMSQLYVSEGNCDSPYIAPENPLFKVNIKDFELTSSVFEECRPGPFHYCDYYYYVYYAYTIENTGNTSLFNLTGKVDFNSRTDTDKIYVFPVGESTTETGSQDAGRNITQPKTYTVTVSVEMWDGTILDSQTKTITVTP